MLNKYWILNIEYWKIKYIWYLFNEYLTQCYLIAGRAYKCYASAKAEDIAQVKLLEIIEYQISSWYLPFQIFSFHNYFIFVFSVGKILYICLFSWRNISLMGPRCPPAPPLDRLSSRVFSGLNHDDNHHHDITTMTMTVMTTMSMAMKMTVGTWIEMILYAEIALKQLAVGDQVWRWPIVKYTFHQIYFSPKNILFHWIYLGKLSRTSLSFFL